MTLGMNNDNTRYAQWWHQVRTMTTLDMRNDNTRYAQWHQVCTMMTLGMHNDNTRYAQWHQVCTMTTLGKHNDNTRYAQWWCQVCTIMVNTQRGTYLSLLDGLQCCLLNAFTIFTELHVAQHHAGTQQQSCGVGLVLSSYVWSRAVNLSHKTSLYHTHDGHIIQHHMRPRLKATDIVIVGIILALASASGLQWNVCCVQKPVSDLLSATWHDMTKSINETSEVGVQLPEKQEPLP